MTAPTYQSTTVTDFGSDATTHAASMPGTVNSGELLLAIAAFDGSSTTITTPSGWTKIGGFGTDPVAGVYAKVAAGTEGGTTVDFATSNAQRGSVHVIRVNGSWYGSLAGVIAGMTFTANTGSMHALSIGGTAKDVLWVAFQFKSSATAFGGSPPSSYTNENKTGTGENTGASAGIATATRANSVSEEELTTLWNAADTGFRQGLIAILPNNTVAVTGTGTIPMPSLSVAGTGVQQPKGTGSFTLPFLTVTGSGVMTTPITGSGSIAMPFLTVSGDGTSGTPITGDGAIELPFLTVTGEGAQSHPVTGTSTYGMPFLTITGTGLITVDIPDEITPGGGSESGGTVAFLDVYRPDGTLVIAAMPYVISYKLRRELNAIGSWTIQIPVSEPIVETYALSRLITRGWTINLSVDGVHPKQRLDYNYLLYRGVVELKSYAIDESGAAICELSGANRATVLSERITPTSADYVQETMQAVAEDIEDGLAGGITFPANASRPISIRFNNDDGDGIISLYSRLIKLGEQARWALRERWGEDDLEFIALDGAPDAGYRMIASEYWRAGHPQAAIVAGTPELRRDGSGMITRIIPFGVDTITEFDTEAEVNMNLAESRYGITPTSPASLSFDFQPTVGKYMNLGGTTYTFRTTATAPGDIEIGSTLDETQNNITAAVRGTDGLNTRNDNVYLHAWDGNSARISYGNKADTADAIEVTGNIYDDGNTSTAGDMSSASRTVEVPLTLEHAPGNFPYEVKQGTNPDGSNYWYLEDEDAIENYGLIEMALTRSDIKNPNDDSVSRAKAANVLYQFAWSQLTRGKSPKVFFSAPIANGQEVWALPGDRMHVQYSGLVSIGGGVVVWEDVDAWMLVTTREEESTESGARAVKLTLTAPEVPFEITGLPEAMGLPGATGGGEDGPGDDGDGEDEGTEEDGGDDSGDGVSFPPPDPWIPPDLYPPGVPPGVMPGDYGSPFPDCCDDPTTTITDIGDPIEAPPDGTPIPEMFTRYWEPTNPSSEGPANGDWVFLYFTQEGETPPVATISGGTILEVLRGSWAGHVGPPFNDDYVNSGSAWVAHIDSDDWAIEVDGEDISALDGASAVVVVNVGSFINAGYASQASTNNVPEAWVSVDAYSTSIEGAITILTHIVGANTSQHNEDSGEWGYWSLGFKYYLGPCAAPGIQFDGVAGALPLIEGFNVVALAGFAPMTEPPP